MAMEMKLFEDDVGVDGVENETFRILNLISSWKLPSLIVIIKHGGFGNGMTTSKMISFRPFFFISI